jgi:hypothetical protein
MRYARVEHDRIAGTIDVVCTQGESPSITEVVVTYDLTSLSPEGTAFGKKFSRVLNTPSSIIAAKRLREFAAASGSPAALDIAGPCNAGNHGFVGGRCAAEVHRAEEH